MPDPVAPTTAVVLPAGTTKLTPCRTCRRASYAKSTPSKRISAPLTASGTAPGVIRDLAVLLEQREHPVHVRQALLDLAVDHAEEVERDVQLDHEGVDQHQVADRHPAFDHAECRTPEDQRQRDCDDGLLAGVQDVQRLLRQHRRALAVGQRLVVTARLVVLVAEVLHRLEVQQRVDRARLRLALQFVPAPPHGRAPVRDGRP